MKIANEKMTFLSDYENQQLGYVAVCYDKDEEKIFVEYENKRIAEIASECREAIFSHPDRKSYTGVLQPDGLEIIKAVSIHTHTGYSLLDGRIRISDLVETVEYCCAITDHGNMFGTLDFYKKMKKAGKKPIIGMEVYSDSLVDGSKSNYHLILLAKNITGFKNLMKITTESYKRMHHGKPHVDKEILEKYKTGLVVTSACIGGEIPKLLLNNQYDTAKELAEWFKKNWNDDFYLEIQNHGIEKEKKVNALLTKLSKDTNIPLVAASDSHYLKKEDGKIHEVLLCIGTKSTLHSERRFKFDGDGYHVYSDDEYEERFYEYPEALDSTIDIMKKCDLTIKLNDFHMPKFDVPSGFKDEDEYFVHLVKKGFTERFYGTEKDCEEYKERLEFEIQTILKMGYSGYFLIVSDFISYAKNNGILVGPGRGSACGSLVAYCLRITELDPIPLGLLFERFLNPDRVSMPDIDVDFADEKREQVIEYVKMKYGLSSVSKIVTFGTLAARAAISDVGRVMGIPVSDVKKITKCIPQEPNMTIKKALEESVDFAAYYDSCKEYKAMIDYASKLEGLPRNASVHACGLLITPTDVSDYIPQMTLMNEEGLTDIATQYNMVECEEMGCLKMDFLGLRTMSVFDNALKNINKKRKECGQEAIEYKDIPIDEIEVYKFIAEGNTAGIFQLESSGMTKFMKELFQDVSKFKDCPIDKKREIGLELYERLIAGIALFRPGPLEEIPNYINNMLHPETVAYDTPKIKPILQNTYGILIYQEQVIFAVRELAGFSKGQADEIRRAMGKKKEYIVNEYESRFIYGSEEEDKLLDKPFCIKGCVSNGIPESEASLIWQKMKKFAKYAFNKSHAAAYADIAARCAWLAYHYPAEFFCATLNSFIGKADKVQNFVVTCQKKGIPILPPDINASDELFTVAADNSIRYGLKGLRNISGVSEIVAERENGEFQNMQSFIERMVQRDSRKIDKRLMEALIFSSAMDCFPGTRNAKNSIAAAMIKNAVIEKTNTENGQMTLFDGSFGDYSNITTIPIPDLPEYDKRFLLDKELEYSGFYITSHPLDEFPEILNNKKISYIASFINQDGEDQETSNSVQGKDEVKVFAIMEEYKVKRTKENKPYVTFVAKDKSGEIKCIAFSECVNKCFGEFGEKFIVGLTGYITYDYGPQLVVNKCKKIK